MMTSLTARSRTWRAAVPLAAACALCFTAVPAAASPGTAAAVPETVTTQADGEHRTAPDSIRATPRLLAYYQTIYETGADGVRRYVDPTPLVESVSDVNVGAIHLNDDGTLTVNDIPADHPELVRMWEDLHAMQEQGVRVNAFVGGAAPGTYINLAADFDTYYAILRDFLRTYELDGVDLDIEEPFSLDNTERLVRQLRADFGPDFVITLTPVAADMAGLTDFSGGFDYAELESRVGEEISWYNTQFYCGWGDLATTTRYEQILDNGFTPERIVAGTVTNPANCAGYVEPATFDETVGTLVAEYEDFGGIFGWEYFNSLGVDGGGRETWFEHVRDVIGWPQAAVTAVTLPSSVEAGTAVTATVTTFPDYAEVAYRWLLDGEPIEGATGATYTPAPADAGGELSVAAVALAARFVVSEPVISAPVTVTAATQEPTEEPTTEEPTTEEPTTEEPTTEEPTTDEPTVEPTEQPTGTPTDAPTVAPTSGGSGSLPQTGAGILPLSVLAAVLGVAGLAVASVRRTRTEH